MVITVYIIITLYIDLFMVAFNVLQRLGNENEGGTEKRGREEEEASERKEKT